MREDWDNAIWDRLAQGHDVSGDSVQACAEACEADETCLQYLWRGEKIKQCILMPCVSHGRQRADGTGAGGFRVFGLDGGEDRRMEEEYMSQSCVGFTEHRENLLAAASGL